MRIQGVVESGLGRAAKRLRCISVALKNEIGYAPYPGTLNIACAEIPKFGSALPHADIERLGRSNARFRLFRATLRGLPVWIARSFSQLKDPDNTLEIMADRNLREHFSPSDGDSVELVLE